MIKHIHRVNHGMASRCRNMLYRLLGVDFRDYCWLRAIEIPRQWEDITLHGCALDRGVVLQCSGEPRSRKIEIGRGTYINRYTMLDAHEHIKLGRNVMVGPMVYITDGNHGMTANQSVKSQPMTTAPVVIEDEAWIGTHVTILPGVTVGRGAIIGAGSVVTRDVPAESISFGIPAMMQRRRE